MSADGELMHTAVIDAEHAGQRLDAALLLLCSLGVRGRRRLIEDGAVLVNGRRGRAGQPVVCGDIISLLSPAQQPRGPQARLISRDAAFVFLHKPAGLHTAHLQGRDSDSLEAQARLLVPDAEPELLQRLDLQTSGIVTAALTPESAAAFRAAEREGIVEKRYVCLLEGELQGARLVQTRMVSSGGAAMRALNDADPDPARWTAFTPLAVMDKVFDIPGPFSLAGVVIHRGARHQIRAHAASLGLPLAGDRLYGGQKMFSGTFFLHHGRINCLGRAVISAPDSTAIPAAMSEISRRWFACSYVNS